MGRKPAKSRAEDYGLPALTTQEAARVLDVDEGAFINWLHKTVRPSPSQWSMWENHVRTLPEPLIRLYLTQKHRDAEATRASIQRSLRLRARDEEAERGKSVGTQHLQREAAKKRPDEKRAAG